ncbi:MAG: hypothetical protein JSS35_00045 [Proteobacteria bacterium]|nr:hypothetical protein [Pseudomonadota bacterium]
MAFAAVVARTSPQGMEYFVQTVRGRDEWAVNAQAAAKYQNLREATRAALRLPSSLKAFALPID